MPDGWHNVIAHCEECYHTWAMPLPPNWDGSPVMCINCGETCSVEVGE